MTCDILTVGHIKCLEQLKSHKYCKRPTVIIGLLSEKALKGYKKCVNSYKDRHYILSSLDPKLVDFIVKQDSLNPYEYLMRFEPEAIASGDGWEDDELEAFKKYNKFFNKKYGRDITLIDIKLPGEKGKKYSSTKIKEKCKKLYS